MKRLLVCFVAALLGLPLLALLPASASHGDGNYDIPVWFHWSESTLDVLIVPPNHGQIVNENGVLNGGDPKEATPLNSYLRATEDSIADWDRAVSMFGADWLKAGLATNVYVVGRDSIPTPALSDPEILVVSDETKGNILGVAISTRPCIVDNSKFFVTSFTYEDMYNINSQEYGHCLGLDHVVDNHPEHDALAGIYRDRVGAKGNHLHCVSNLDVRGLEAVFGRLFGRPAGETASIPVAQYGTTCSPPPATGPAPGTTPSPTTSSAPSPTPAPEPSPTSEPTDPPSHEQHLRTVRLALRRHLVAVGEVTATDDHSRCEAGVRVQIERLRRGNWKRVEPTDTTSDGRFRVRLRDVPGRYRATVEATDECSSATSRSIRHRHG